MRVWIFYIFAVLLIPFGTALAANGGSRNSDSAERVHPCKSGNCGLEYKQRGGGGGKSKSVLKMTFGKSRGRGAGYGRRGGSGGRRSFRRSSRGRRGGGYRRSARSSSARFR